MSEVRRRIGRGAGIEAMRGMKLSWLPEGRGRGVKVYVMRWKR